MVHQTSSDLKKWGAVIEDVAYPTYTDRPGMPVVTKVSTQPRKPILSSLSNPSIDTPSSRTANTSTFMNTALSSALQATHSLSTIGLHLTPRMLLRPLINAWLSPAVHSQPPRRTLYGRRMVARMALSLQAPEHRVLCSSTRLLEKVNGQRSHLPKNMDIRGL
jgi:hypothetical protein